MTDLSVVILTWNQRYYTLRLLESLKGLVADDRCEIIVVDNGSSDDTVGEIARRFPGVRVICNDRNLGVAAARNIGLRAASGRNLMILDNDTVATPDAIRRLSDYLDNHPQTGLVAPRLTDMEGITQASFKPFPGLGVKIRNFFRGKGSTSYATVIPDKPIHPFYVIGAAQMFRRSDYERIGGIDEHIFYGPEDADFCMSIRDLGLNITYLPDVVIIHDWQRATTGSIFNRNSLSHIRGLIYFYCKHRRIF